MLIFWFDVFRVGGNQVRVIRVGVIRVGEIRIFAPIFFNFKKNILPRVLENYVASRVFTYFCIMPRKHAPVGEIQRPPNGVKDVEAPLNVNL